MLASKIWVRADWMAVRAEVRMEYWRCDFAMLRGRVRATRGSWRRMLDILGLCCDLVEILWVCKIELS